MPVIEVEGLTFTYPHGVKPAVVDMGFAVAPGAVFGFLGPSGAGKSTTQKVLIGLLKGHGGRVSILGKAIDAWGTDLGERR